MFYKVHTVYCTLLLMKFVLFNDAIVDSMAYNLRSRVRNILFHNQAECFDGEHSSEDDDESVQQSTNTSTSEYSEAEDAENGTSNQRILDQRKRARGRPSTVLLSKNNTKWNTASRTRTSGL